MHTPHHHPPVAKTKPYKNHGVRTPMSDTPQHRKKEEHTNALRIQRTVARLYPIRRARRCSGHPHLALCRQQPSCVQVGRALVRGHRTPAHGGCHRRCGARRQGDTYVHPLPHPHLPSLIPGRQGPKNSRGGAATFHMMGCAPPVFTSKNRYFNNLTTSRNGLSARTYVNNRKVRHMAGR